MADADRGNRPLSPFMLGTHYRLQLNSAMSLVHRLTGIGLAGCAVLVVWWFLAAAGDPQAFAFVDGLLTSWVGGLVLLAGLASLWYHFFNGIRHLVWDAGFGFEIDQVHRSGVAVIAAAAVMTVITWIVAYF